MKTLIFLSLLVSTERYDVERYPQAPTASGSAFNGHFADDTNLSLGNTDGAPDYWCEHDTAATPDELACWTTDGNGAGADAKWMSVQDGTDDVIFTGNVSTTAGTCSCEQLTTTDDATVTDQLALKRSAYTIPATITVATDAATVDLANGDFQVLDLDGSDADAVTITVSNPTAGQAWALKIIQDDEASTTTFSPLLYWAAGGAPVITTTNDAIDLVSCVYDGAKHLCSITQNLKTAP